MINFAPHWTSRGSTRYMRKPIENGSQFLVWYYASFNSEITVHSAQCTVHLWETNCFRASTWWQTRGTGRNIHLSEAPTGEYLWKLHQRRSRNGPSLNTLNKRVWNHGQNCFSESNNGDSLDLVDPFGLMKESNTFEFNGSSKDFSATMMYGPPRRSMLTPRMLCSPDLVLKAVSKPRDFHGLCSYTCFVPLCLFLSECWKVQCSSWKSPCLLICLHPSKPLLTNSPRYKS